MISLRFRLIDARRFKDSVGMEARRVTYAFNYLACNAEGGSVHSLHLSEI